MGILPSRKNQTALELSNENLQLQIIYDLTLLLQAAPDVKSVQQRVLSAITGELGFPRVVLGLTEPEAYAISSWAIHPAENAPALPSIPLDAEGLITAAIQTQKTYWCTDKDELSTSPALNDWLGEETGLVLPLALREHSVGVLIVATGSPHVPDEHIKTLKLVAGQAAVALGTTMLCIDRAQQLAIEQERNRIARDIHDTVAQSMFGIIFSLDACINMLPEHGDIVREELKELHALAIQVRDQVRHSIFNLWPSKLTLAQFKEDIRSYVTSCAGSQKFQVHFTADGDFDRLPSAIRRNLYRVTQEALANCAQHAGVDEAHVFLKVGPCGPSNILLLR